MPTENRSSTIEQNDHIEGIIDMVSVPRVLTREMLNGVCMHPDLARSLWSALLKNAPQPAPQPHPEPIAWMVDTAIWWHKPGAEQDSAKTGEPMVPLGPCDSPSEIARLTAQFKDWQASHHHNYCKAADERDELRGQLEKARRLLHTASIRLANWLEPGDDPRKQIIAFLEDTAEPTGTEEQPGFELIGPQLLEWNRSLVQPCILIGHEYGVATKAMKLARQALSGKSR